MEQLSRPDGLKWDRSDKRAMVVTISHVLPDGRWATYKVWEHQAIGAIMRESKRNGQLIMHLFGFLLTHTHSGIPTYVSPMPPKWLNPSHQDDDHYHTHGIGGRRWSVSAVPSGESNMNG